MGYFIGSTFMYMTGLIISIYSGSSDPIAFLSNLNMGISVLLVVIFATVTTTFLDVYSTVLSTLNLNQKLSKRMLIIIYSALGIVLALFFPMESYQDFLYLIGSLFAPAFTVVIMDYFILKKDFSNKNMNVAGILAALCGTVFYYYISKIDLPLGSSIPTMIATIGIYHIRSLNY